MSSCARAIALLAAMRATTPAQTTGQVSIVAGTATDVRGISSRAVTVAPSITVNPDPRLQFALIASGTRFDNDQWSLGGGARGVSRYGFSRFVALTTHAAANATTTSYKLSYFTADLTPAVEGTIGAFTAFAGVHAAGASTSIPSQQIAPGPFGGPLPQTSTRVSRSTIAPLIGASVRATSDAGETIVVGARQESGRVNGVAATDRVLSASIWQGAVSLSAAAGMRREAGASSAFGSGALSLGVTPSVALEIAAGSYLADRLSGAPGGRSVSIGVSLRSPTRDPHLPAPTGIGAPAAGLTRLSIREPDATRVAVAGDFTNWKEVHAQRATNGVWYVDLRIPPGQYRYAFRIDDKEWKVPEGAAASGDDLGGKTAWLAVAAPSTTTRP